MSNEWETAGGGAGVADAAADAEAPDAMVVVVDPGAAADGTEGWLLALLDMAEMRSKGAIQASTTKAKYVRITLCEKAVGNPPVQPDSLRRCAAPFSTVRW